MSEHEYREVSETVRHTGKDTLRTCEASRDFWKFMAVIFFLVSLFCILELYGCLPDFN